MSFWASEFWAPEFWAPEFWGTGTPVTLDEAIPDVHVYLQRLVCFPRKEFEGAPVYLKVQRPYTVEDRGRVVVRS